jgi:hypothetical protein
VERTLLRRRRSSAIKTPPHAAFLYTHYTLWGFNDVFEDIWGLVDVSPGECALMVMGFRVNLEWFSLMHI